MKYSDMDLLKICVVDVHTIGCPLLTCQTEFEVMDVPVSDGLGAVFGMSGDTLARVHGEQILKRVAYELRAHLRSHPFDDWLEELLEGREALKAQLAMWQEMGPG